MQLNQENKNLNKKKYRPNCMGKRMVQVKTLLKFHFVYCFVVGISKKMLHLPSQELEQKQLLPKIFYTMLVLSA